MNKEQIKIGLWVRIRGAGKWKTTYRVGMIVSFSARKATVQLGTDGPFQSEWIGKLLGPASKNEIDKMTGMK